MPAPVMYAPLVETRSGEEQEDAQDNYITESQLDTPLNTQDSRNLVQSDREPKSPSKGAPRRGPKRCCQRGRWWIVVPEEGTRSEAIVHVWDDIIIMCLLAAAYVVPFNVAFPDVLALPIAVFNRSLDILFTLDIVLNFCLAYRKLEKTGQHRQEFWERDPCRIVKRYCACPGSYQGAGGWFWLDLPAVLPGWRDMARGRLITLERPSHRLYHCLRFTRFLRLFRTERQERFEASIEAVRIEWGFPYTLTEGIKFLFLITVVCHVAACVWVLLEGKVTYDYFEHVDENDESWLSALINSKGDPCRPSVEHDPACFYALAAYWSMMTLTTVGYGDITPQNRLEYILSTGFMLLAGFVWAYFMAAVVNMITNMDQHSMQFKQEMDAINSLMELQQLPHELRVELRRYLLHSKELVKRRNQEAILTSRVSLGLQGKVAMQNPVIHTLKERVFWFIGLEHDAILHLLRLLESYFYSPKEVIPMHEKMIIVQGGHAYVGNKVLVRNDVWGHETILLETPSLLDYQLPRTLTYVDVLILWKHSLREVCRAFPSADRRVRRATIRTAVYRSFIQRAKGAAKSRSMMCLSGTREYGSEQEMQEPLMRSTSNMASGSAIWSRMKRKSASHVAIVNTQYGEDPEVVEVERSLHGGTQDLLTALLRRARTEAELMNTASRVCVMFATLLQEALQDAHGLSSEVASQLVQQATLPSMMLKLPTLHLASDNPSN